MNYNRRSKNITEGVARAPNRSMYYALGYQQDDFVKPMIGVANGHSTITPCNSGLQKLADAAVIGIKEAGANPQIFGTPTISDGMAMGTEGMKYSLVSREVIADCVETCVGGQWMDGVLVIGGCDKNMPGGMMGMLRANVPALYVYGGTILPGKYKGQDLNIVSVFEAVGQFSAGKMSEEDFCQIERKAIPGSGSCGGMYTANTMSSSFEALGMSLPYSSTMANVEEEIVASVKVAAGVLVEAVKADLKPRDIVTKEAIENAVAGGDGHRRLDQRSAALPGHRPRGGSRMDHRRLRARAPAHPRAVQPQAQRPVPGDRPAPRRRHSGGDEGTAQARPAAWRRHDHHRQDTLAERAGRCAGPAARRPEGDLPPVSTARCTPQGHLAILKGNLSAGRLRSPRSPA